MICAEDRYFPIYLFNHALLAMKVVEDTSVADLECVKMWYGNLKLVFIVTNKLNFNNIIDGQVSIGVLL